MNDHRLEHEIRTALDEHAPMLPPNHLLHTFEFSARRTRRTPRWLALIKESPMRTNSHLAVGSPTARVAAILVATMLLAVSLAAAGVAGQQLLAAGGPIVVAQDGSGEYTTITDAVAAAADGDEILVRPGTYQEVVIIEADITLRGDGAREDVILEFGTDGPTIWSWSGSVPYGLMLVDSEATVSDLTVRGPNAAMAFVFVGGAPTLERVANELEGEFAGRTQLSVVPLHSAGGTIRDSLLDGPVWHGDAGSLREHEDVTGTGRWVAEDNTLDGGFWLEVTDGSSFLRNTITDGGGFELGGSGSVLVAENVAGFIELDEQSDGYTVRDNVVRSEGSDKPAIVLGNGVLHRRGQRHLGGPDRPVRSGGRHGDDQRQSVRGTGRRDRGPRSRDQRRHRGQPVLRQRTGPRGGAGLQPDARRQQRDLRARAGRVGVRPSACDDPPGRPMIGPGGRRSRRPR